MPGPRLAAPQDHLCDQEQREGYSLADGANGIDLGCDPPVTKAIRVAMPITTSGSPTPGWGSSPAPSISSCTPAPHDGIHYAAGYCGSGVGMASYLAMKLGLKILSRPEGASALDDLPFPRASPSTPDIHRSPRPRSAIIARAIGDR